MLKELLEKVIDLSNGKLLETRDGRIFHTKGMEQIDTPEPRRSPMKFNSLDAILDYAQGGFDEMPAQDVVFRVSPREVELVGSSYGYFKQRDLYAAAAPFSSRINFRFDSFMDLEDFIIGLQSGFVRDENVKNILKVVGNLKAESSSVTADDGVTQVVTRRKGVSRYENVELPNPVALRPYRTFQEIPQPASLYILRIRGDEDSPPQVALFECIDHQWESEACKEIKAYLLANGCEIPIFI